jgi:5-(carboxyamino)imidazole ribonucleotide mutase
MAGQKMSPEKLAVPMGCAADWAGIGIPLRDGAFDGPDALLSTIQMPTGVPAAARAAGQADAIKAAPFAVQIPALNDRSRRTKFQCHRQALKRKLFEVEVPLQRELFAT